MHLSDLKHLPVTELVDLANSDKIENAGRMRKQDLIFAILKNKAYPELQELSKYAEKHYPKTTLSVYHQALYYEKMGEFKKAVKEYKKAFVKDEIRELTKDFMLSRSESLKNKEDESKVEEYAEPEPAEGEKKKEGE